MLLRLINKRIILKTIISQNKVVLPQLCNQRHYYHKQIPNVLSLSRLGCSFLVGYYIIDHSFYNALFAITYCGISDFLDGLLARRWDCQSKFGQIVDPLADKCLAANIAISLTIIGQLPIYLTGLIIIRDVLIVTGALYIWKKHGNHIELKPSNLSKLNTGVLVTGLLIHVLNRIDFFNDEFIFYTNVCMTLSTLVSGLYYLKIIKNYL